MYKHLAGVCQIPQKFLASDRGGGRVPKTGSLAATPPGDSEAGDNSDLHPGGGEACGHLYL